MVPVVLVRLELLFSVSELTSYRPKSDDITLSLLSRAKAAGFSALIVTLDTTIIGWRPHDLERAYLPFRHGLGVQVGISDPVFMARLGKQPITETKLKFPYDVDKLDKAFADGDLEAREFVHLGIEWMKEANSGIYRTWEDLKFLRDNWEGPLILKGIQCAEVCLTVIPCRSAIDSVGRTRKRHSNMELTESWYPTTVSTRLSPTKEPQLIPPFSLFFRRASSRWCCSCALVA